MIRERCKLGITELDHPAAITLNPAETMAFITNYGNNTVT